MELIFKNADAKVETKGDSSLNKQQLCVQSATEMKKNYKLKGRAGQTRHSQVNRYDVITYGNTMLEN